MPLKIYMQPWIIAIIILAAVILLCFTLAVLTFKIAFKRCEKNPLLKYFAAEDFGLSEEPVSVKCGKTTLNGFIYRNNAENLKKGLVIFQHGMGPGHAAYTTEIAYFCNHGYPVLALDIKGCNLSEGKSSGGMYEGVKCVKAAIDFARANARFKTAPLYLVGHSWGGYSVLCASAERKVDKVVAISAPSSPVRTIFDGAAKFISKPLAAILCPFWYVLNFIRFGARGNANAAKCVKKNDTPTLLIHGDNDKIVNFKNAAYNRTNCPNVEKYISTDKAHNPYNTRKAQEMIIELNDKLISLGKNLSAEDREYFEKFDFNAATEEDEEVMRIITRFIEYGIIS